MSSKELQEGQEGLIEKLAKLVPKRTELPLPSGA